MASNITNIMEIGGSAENVKKVMDFIGSPDSEKPSERIIDLGRIVPMPAELDIEAPAGTTSLGYVLARTKDPLLLTPEEKRLIAEGDAEPERRGRWLDTARRLADNIAKHGCPTRSEWRAQNWGTRWNAYGAERTAPERIRFQTAWKMPHEAMAALSRRFPEVTVIVTFADEDLFKDCGRVSYRGGQVRSSDRPSPDTRAAYDITVMVIPEAERMYRWDGKRKRIVKTPCNER